MKELMQSSNFQNTQKNRMQSKSVPYKAAIVIQTSNFKLLGFPENIKGFYDLHLRLSTACLLKNRVRYFPKKCCDFYRRILKYY